jgi:hypothetical protein
MSTGKKVWEPLRLQRVGLVGDVIQGGGGKLSPPTFDSGDDRKPKGLE